MALTDEGIIDVPGLASRWVRLASGARAHYMTAGESGPAVVLLHGAVVGSSAAAGWRYMAPFLGENGFRVYCPDLPGFGLTEGAELYHPAQIGHVEFVHEFVTALGLDKIRIGGQHVGAVIATGYILAHPEKVLCGATIASGGFGRDIATGPERRAVIDSRTDVPATPAFDGTPESMKKMMEVLMYRVEEDVDDLTNMRTMIAHRNAAYFQARRDYLANSDPNIEVSLSMKGRFDKLNLPLIYLHGRQDVHAVVELATDLYEPRLPNVQFFYPDECGHECQTDQPEMLNQVFLEFFRDGKISRKTAEWAGVSKNRPELAGLIEG